MYFFLVRSSVTDIGTPLRLKGKLLQSLRLSVLRITYPLSAHTHGQLLLQKISELTFKHYSSDCQKAETFYPSIYTIYSRVLETDSWNTCTTDFTFSQSKIKTKLEWDSETESGCHPKSSTPNM